MSDDRSYVNSDSSGRYVESLVYRDLPNWKNDVTPKEKSAIRVMTFNVHGFTDRQMVDTLDEILDVIKRVDPDLLVIEEFVLYSVKRKIAYLNFKKFLKGLGFTTITTDRLQNNVLASKFSGALSPTLELGKDPVHRVFRFANIIHIPADTIGGDSDLILVGTHLDVYDESGKTRLKQAEMILDAIEDIRTTALVNSDGQDIQVIVTGDFNCLRPEDYDAEEWEHICRVDSERGVDTERMVITDRGDQLKQDAVLAFEDADLIDASVQLGSPLNLSVWANRRVDYICGRNVKFLKTSTVRNACSDHYAVYADFMP